MPVDSPNRTDAADAGFTIRAGTADRTSVARPSCVLQQTMPARRGTEQRGWVRIRPEESAFFDGLGICTAQDFLELPGEIVSGHPDRHVLWVRLGDAPGRTVYLKREHHVRRRDRLKNALAGYGWTSKSVREAIWLQALESDHLPVPRWLAFGEDGRGRAFLLVEAIPNGVELRQWLEENSDDLPARQRMGENLIEALARLHAIGVRHPDLSAKHVWVSADSLAVSFLDWQRASRRCPMSAHDRGRALALLHASISEVLVPPAQRFRWLRLYCRCAGLDRAYRRRLLAALRPASARLCKDRHYHSQRLPWKTSQPQRLVWLDGEAFCCIPSVAEELSAPEWRQRVLGESIDHDQDFSLLDGRKVRFRRRTYPVWHLGRIWQGLREGNWRAPELRRARLLFHLERHNVPTPRLLAFGQRNPAGGQADAFLLTEVIPNARHLVNYLAEARYLVEHLPHTPRDFREQLDSLHQLGATLALLHEAGCRLGLANQTVPLFWANNRWYVEPMESLRYVRKVPEAIRHRELLRLAHIVALQLGLRNALRVLRGYGLHERSQRRPLAQQLLRKGPSA